MCEWKVVIEVQLLSSQLDRYITDILKVGLDNDVELSNKRILTGKSK